MKQRAGAGLKASWRFSLGPFRSLALSLFPKPTHLYFSKAAQQLSARRLARSINPPSNAVAACNRSASLSKSFVASVVTFVSRTHRAPAFQLHGHHLRYPLHDVRSFPYRVPAKSALVRGYWWPWISGRGLRHALRRHLHFSR